MADCPEISIVVPCYNYGHLLAETLDSVRTQTFENWECIIVDDGSTDNTEEIVSMFAGKDKRFKYLFQQNNGPSIARNTGIRAATGQFVQFLDADDLIEQGKLEAQLRCFRENPYADIVYGDVRFFSTGKPQERRYSMLDDNKPWMPMASGSGKEVLKCLLVANIMVISSPLMRKSVFDTCGVLDETLIWFEDWEFWLRCALQGKYFYYLQSNESMVLVRYHDGSLSRSQIKMFEANIGIRKKMFSLLKDSDLYEINMNNYRLNGLALAFENIRIKNRITGLFQIMKYSFNLFVVKESIRRLMGRFAGREKIVPKDIS